MGFTLTLERHSLDAYSATSSPGLNLSVSRTFGSVMPWLPELVAGVNVRNVIRPSIKLMNESVKYPYSFDASLGFRLIPQGNLSHSLLLTTGISKEDMVDPQFAAGLEYSLYDLLHMRGSFNENHPSLGVGLSYKSINFVILKT